MCPGSWLRYAQLLFSSVMGDIRQRNGSIGNNDTYVSVVPCRVDDRVLYQKVDDGVDGEEIEMRTRPEVRDTDADAEDRRRGNGGAFYRVCVPVCCKRSDTDRDKDNDDDCEEEDDTGAKTVEKGKLISTLTLVRHTEPGFDLRSIYFCSVHVYFYTCVTSM